MTFRVFFIAFTLVIVINTEFAKIVACFLILKILNNYLYNSFFAILVENLAKILLLALILA